MKTYLSRFHFSPFAGYAWQAIHNSAPIGPERKTRDEAERDAATFNVAPTGIWDSHSGDFRPLDWSPSNH